MKAQGRKAMLALVLAAASTSVHAMHAEIKVWADVDTTLALLKPDGSPLYDQVQLSFNPGTGLLMPWSAPVRVFSNDTGKDVAVRLANAARLLPVVAAPGAKPVPLDVKLNGQLLGTTGQLYPAGDLFDGVVPGASIVMPLAIAHGSDLPSTAPDPITAAGLYEGTVSIILAQLTAAP